MNKNFAESFHLRFCCVVLTAITGIAASGCAPQDSPDIPDIETPDSPGIEIGTITVDAGEYDRTNTLIRFQTSADKIFGDPMKFRREGYFHYLNEETDLELLRDNTLVLVEEGRTRTRLTVQWDDHSDFDWRTAPGKGALVWVLTGETPGGSTRTFKLMLEEGPSLARPITVEDSDNTHFMVNQGSKPLLRYNYGVVQDSSNARSLDRSFFIHPIWTPSGEIITGESSPEHGTHAGVSNYWNTIQHVNRQLNFWELGDNPGRKVPDDLGPSITEGPVFTSLEFINKGLYNGNTIFRELYSIKAYPLSGENVQLVDISIRQKSIPENLRYIPLEEGATGIMDEEGNLVEGTSMDLLQSNNATFALSGKAEWYTDDVSLDVLTSEGKNRIDGDGTAARWIDVSGPVGSHWGGLAMFDHPSNQKYPTPVTIRADIPYFGYAFTKNTPHTVIMDDPLNLVYRILVHDGHPDMELNERIAQDFANPPTVTFQPLKM